MVLKEFTLSHKKFCDCENTYEIELFKFYTKIIFKVDMESKITDLS